VNGAVALARAGDEFRCRLVSVTASQMRLSTPCDDWCVRDLVNHVVGGNFRYEMILDRAEADVVLRTRDDDWSADDPLAAFDDGLARVTEAFARPGILLEEVHHPKTGSVTGAQLRLLRVNELTVHAWDLARSIGADDRLDDDVVLWLVDGLEPLLSAVGASGLLKAPPSDLRQSVDPQTRLLALLGRVG
jgi:uncharacterized protein (TIGR03086 family)